MKYSTKSAKANIAARAAFDSLEAEAEQLRALLAAFQTHIILRVEQKLDEGKKGWDDKALVSYMKEKAGVALEEGKYIDAAIYAAFLWKANDE